MQETLTQDDIQHILGTIERFAQRAVSPLVERHEVYLQSDQIDQLTGEAQRIGLLNLDSDEGLGLWENLSDPAVIRLSIEILVALAEVNAGVAWHFHQLAFSRYLALRLGLGDVLAQGAGLAVIQGFYGLARTALPRYLLGADLTGEDRELLADYFIPQHPGVRIVFHAVDNWQWMLSPIFTGGQIAWRFLSRDEIDLEHHPHSHGLDEIPTASWKPDNDPNPSIQIDAVTSRQVYGEALQVNALALMAVTLGAVKHGHQLAQDYAAIRYQGGDIINRHPAMQQMLSGISAAVQICSSQLNQISLQEIALARTGQILAVRSALQPLLSQAATDAVQVMGGIGYMRDIGLEKILRDVNQLRLMHGTPGELRLFAAEWERLA